MGKRQGRSMRLLVNRSAAFALCALACSVASAQNLTELARKVGVRVLADATSDKQVMSYTRQRLPYPQMSPGARNRASRILANTSQYRRMPSLQYPVDPNMYQYLVNHPDVAVSTWRAMGISKLRMIQTGRFEFEAEAVDGSDGIADVLWRDANQCLFIVEGRYNSPVLPNSIQASALVWLQYRFVRNAAGETLVNQQVETFLHFHSTTIETIARLASRLTNSILDRNVFEVSLYARMMSQAGKKDPQWIPQVAMRMDGVAPNRRTELVRVSRGQKPYGVKETVRVSSPPRNAEMLQSSGQFQVFERSMRHVSNHVPLMTPPVQQTPFAENPVGPSVASVAEPADPTQSSDMEATAEPMVPYATPLHSTRAEVAGLIDLPPVESEESTTAKTVEAMVEIRAGKASSTPTKTVSVSKDVTGDDESGKSAEEIIEPAPVPPALD